MAILPQDSYGRPARKIPDFGDRLLVTNGLDDEVEELRTTVPVFFVNAVTGEVTEQREGNTTPLPVRLDSAEALTAEAEKIVQVNVSRTLPPYSSACGRCFVCFVLDPVSMHGSQTKRMEHLPQADE